MWALAIDPSNPSTLYAGTDYAGVFKSTNGGGTWNPINSGLSDGYVNALAIDPGNSNIVYAGTLLGGVFKSTNGGDTWNPINSGMTSTDAVE